MPPLPLRGWPACAASRFARAPGVSSDSAAAASSVDAGMAPSLTRGRIGSGGGDRLRRPHRQLVLGPLDAQLDGCRIPAQLRPARDRFGAEAVEELVRVQWVVVEEDGAPGAGATGEGERVAQRRVPPADVVGVLGVGVLAVVDQQRGVVGEREAGDPVLLAAVEGGAQTWLVVGDVGQRGVAVVDPVAERRPAMGDRGGADPGRADLPLTVGGVAEGDVAGQLPHLDRGERRGDVAGDAIAQRGLGGGGPPDHDLGLGPEGGGEEGEAEDVIEVEVGEEDVQPSRLVAEREAEAADAAAGVERQQRAVGEGDADAGGVAAVADRLRPRGGNRAARAPELDLHSGRVPLPFVPVGQKIAMPPWEPCAVRIGKAETSTAWLAPSDEWITYSAWAGRPLRTAVTSGRSS